jgi:hypothetical protein
VLRVEKNDISRMASTVSHLCFSLCTEQGGNGSYLATMLAGGAVGATAGATIGLVGGPVSSFIGGFLGAFTGIVVAGVKGAKT